MKLSGKLVFCILISYYFFHSLSAQTITKLDNGIYNYNGVDYKFDNMEDVFKGHNEAHKKYTSAMKSLNATKSFGTVTLATMAIGTIAAAVDNHKGHCDLICLTTGDIIGLVSWLFIVPTVGTIGIANRISFTSKKKKAITLFNNNSDIGYPNQSPSYDLRIGGGQYGVGLVFSF